MKDEIEFWLLSLAKIFEKPLFYAFVLFLPTQLGKHFWFNFSFVLGQQVDYLSPTLYTTDIFIIGIFLLVILQKKLPKAHPYFSLTVLFLAISIFLSHSPFLGWYGLAKFIELSFVVWYVSREIFRKDIVAICLCVGIVVETILAFWQATVQHSIGGLFYFFGERTFTATTPGIANASIQGQLFLRPYGTFSHPNMLAGFLLVGILLAAYLLSKRRWIRMLFPTTLFATVGILLSLSRTVIATGIVAAFILLVQLFRQRLSRYTLLVVLVILSATFLSIAFFPHILFRLFSFSFGESLTERALLAQSAVRMIFHSPLVGVGVQNFIPSLPAVSQNTVVLQPVHNIYLLIASEAGIVGLLAFIAFLATTVLRALFQKKKSAKRTSGKVFLLLALLAILLIGFFDHYFLTLQQGQLLFALTLGLTLREVGVSRGTIRG